MEEKNKTTGFFLVASDLRNAPISDHLEHGYEDKYDFADALRTITRPFGGRVGECIDERHGFLRLRFHDTPGGKPDEKWVPRYLLTEATRPDYMDALEEEPDEIERELDRAFGFDVD